MDHEAAILTMMGESFRHAARDAEALGFEGEWTGNGMRYRGLVPSRAVKLLTLYASWFPDGTAGVYGGLDLPDNLGPEDGGELAVFGLCRQPMEDFAGTIAELCPEQELFNISVWSI